MRTPAIVAALVMLMALAGLAEAQVVPGATVEDRAINGAKAYLQKHNLKNVEQTILLSSLYNNSFPDFSERWEKLTGIKIKIVPLGYTDIPAKIMAEAVAKTGQFDMFNDFPYTAPDAVGAGVIVGERLKPQLQALGVRERPLFHDEWIDVRWPKSHVHLWLTAVCRRHPHHGLQDLVDPAADLFDRSK